MMGYTIQVFKITARELLVSNDFDLALTLLADDNRITQVVCATVNLDAIVQEFLKSRQIKDLVVYSLLCINSKLLGDLLALFG
jgi:hypothetical protein